MIMVVALIVITYNFCVTWINVCKYLKNANANLVKQLLNTCCTFDNFYFNVYKWFLCRLCVFQFIFITKSTKKAIIIHMLLV